MLTEALHGRHEPIRAADGASQSPATGGFEKRQSKLSPPDQMVCLGGPQKTRRGRFPENFIGGDSRQNV